MDQKLENSLSHLADLFKYGHLEASMTPGLFIDRVADEIKRLREFIRNGVEYGYIHRPEEGDPACVTIDEIIRETTNAE